MLEVRELERNRSPEEARAHLHRHVALVICIPEPDIAPILHYARICRGLYTHGLIGAGRRFNGFLAFALHGDEDGFSGVKNRDLKTLAYLQWLRRSVKNCGKKIRDTGRNRGFLMFADARYEVFLIEDRFALSVVELQIAIDLAAAFDELFTEFRGATGAAIKGGLEAITDPINEIDGADGVTGYGDALHVTIGFLMKCYRAGGKDAPIHAICQCLPRRKSKPRPRSWELQQTLGRLGPRSCQQQKTKNNGEQSITPIQILGSLFF